jgi:hypothetical protein
LWIIHGVMGVYSRFKIRRLLSLLLWMLGVAQHWKGCLVYKRKLFTYCFLGEFNPSSNETCWKVRMSLCVHLLKPFVLFIGKVQILVLFHLRRQSKFSFHWRTWHFNGHFIHPLRAKASTSMLSNGGKTNLLH